MGKLIRIDSFDVTFADSFTRTALKVVETFVHTDGTKAKKGSGEKRIYVGSDEAYYDSFFQLDYNPKFFIQKSDIEDYYKDALEELSNPSYKYGPNENETKQIFREFRTKLNDLQQNRLFFQFSKTFDSQNRYYLVLKPGKENKENYDYIRDIALPRVTRLLFVKFRDEATKAIYIYVKPVIWKKNKDSEEDAAEYYRVELEPTQGVRRKSNYREGQVKYREAILKKYPYCVVTGVTDPDLLIACHIKNHARCNPEEKYDEWNGLSMTPTIHTLFDIGYLSFNEKGEMILSGFLRNMDRKRLHLDGIIRIPLNPKSLPYLQWHNEHTFRKVNIESF